MLGACTLITLYTSGIVYLGFTAIFQPIAEEFNWSYAQISLAASLRGLEEGLLAPLMGILVDRWGPKRLLIMGSIFSCFGLIILSRMSSLGMFYLAFAFVSVGTSTCSGTVTVTAVANWFRRKVGIATGILVSGWALGGLLVPVVTLLVDTLTWRTAMFILGLSMVVIILPLALLVRHKPEDYGYQPDGDTVVGGDSNGLQMREKVEQSLSAKQALQNRAFWHLALGAICHMFVVGAVITHLMPYLSTVGMGRSDASMIALLVPMTSIGARLGVGWLGNRFDNKRLYATGFVLFAVGLLFLGFSSQGIYLLLPFLLTFSSGWGGNVTLRMTLVRRYFGRSNYGTILGCVSGLMMIGTIAGAPIAGWVVDTWGSYQGAWFGFAIVAMAGFILVLTMPSKPEMTKQTGL